MHHYFAGVAAGIIILQAAIIAPSMAKTLDMKSFGVSIRVIWPKFFLMVLGTGIGCLASLIFVDAATWVQFLIAGLTSGLALVCYAIIPATNRATDRGDQQTFKRLHLASVVCTVTMLLANICFLFT